MDRSLCRSRRARIVAGVAGGLGEYLGVDPMLVRLFFVVLALVTRGAFLLYIVLWIALPEAPLGEPAYPAVRLDPQKRSLLFGGALIMLGFLLLLRELGIFRWLDLHRLWPLLLIAAGVALLVDRARSVRW